MIIDKLVFGILLPYPQTYTNQTTHPPATRKQFFSGNVELSTCMRLDMCITYTRLWWLMFCGVDFGFDVAMKWKGGCDWIERRTAERACGRTAGSSINRFICFFIALKWKWGYDGCQQNDDDGYWGRLAKELVIGAVRRSGGRMEKASWNYTLLHTLEIDV